MKLQALLYYLSRKNYHTVLTLGLGETTHPRLTDLPGDYNNNNNNELTYRG